MPENRKSQTRLDPRAPLVIDTRELGRRAGSMRRLHLSAPAPEGLGLEMVGVPAGSELDLDLRLEAVMEGVLVSGTVTGPLVGECGRCLEPLTSRIEVDVQQLFAYPDSTTDLTDDDEDTGRLEGDHLDLEPVVRDAVVLALPLTPLCREDCGGLCVDCGARLDDVPPGHGHEQRDPRWAALAGLQDPALTEQDQLHDDDSES